MTRIDDIEARSKADPSDKALADLVAFVRKVQKILEDGEDYPHGYAEDLNEIEEALNHLNGEEA